MSHIVLHIVFLKFAHNYYFYADALPLTSSRSGTKFATMKLSLIKCQRASMVCFRISSYAQTYIHFIRKTKLLIHTSTLAILKQEHFSYISSVLEHFFLFSFIAPYLFFAYLPKLEQFFFPACFAPSPKLSSISGLGQFFQIHPLCSNSRHMHTFPLGATTQNQPTLLQLHNKATFPVWVNFSISTRFAPTSGICPLFPLEQLLQIYLLCSNSPCPILHPKRTKPVTDVTGFVYSLKTDISSASYLSYSLSLSTTS